MPDFSHDFPPYSGPDLICRLTVFACVIAMFFLWGCSTGVKPPEPYAPEKKISEKAPVKNKIPDYYGSNHTGSRPYNVNGKWYRPLARAKGFRQQGLASWYGDDFHGKMTSSGEIYNMHGISAAHKILPLGTYVRVKNLINGRTIVVRINDRGPFVPGRIIDLSYGAAKKLGIVGPGTAPVEVAAIGWAPLPFKKIAKLAKELPPDYDKGNFTIQVGAFGDRKNAEKLKRMLMQKYKTAQVIPFRAKNKTMYRVVVGKCASFDEAVKYEKLLKSKGFHDAFAVAE